MPNYLGFSGLADGTNILVWEVEKGSPAERAGLQIGARIEAGLAAVYGRSAASTAGSAVDLKVMRKSAQFGMSIVPTRGGNEHFSASMIDGKVAYIRIHDFSFDLDSSDFVSTLVELKRERPTGWILDLRNNPGGDAETAAGIASDLGVDGIVFKIVERSGETSELKAHNNHIADSGPLTVIVNEWTASSAEVLASTLLPARHATLVGNQTAGHVLASKVFALQSGALELAVGRIFAGPKHQILDKIGVLPDQIVPLLPESMAEGTDSQLEVAIRSTNSRQ